MTNDTSTPESTECSQEYILNLPEDQRTDKQCWQIALNNKGLVVFLINKRGVDNGRNDNYEDLIQEGLIAVCNAARSYKTPYFPKEFRSYARKAIKNAIERTIYNSPLIPIKEGVLQKLRKNKPLTPAMASALHVLTLTRDEDYGNVYSANVNEYDEDDFVILKMALATLEPTAYQVLAYLYGFHGECLRVKEIAKTMSLSRSAVSRARDKAFNKLRIRVKRAS